MARVNDDYIVRIYRRVRRDPRLLIGTVERVGGAPGRQAFGSLDDLWSILLPPPRTAASEQGRARAQMP